MSHTSRRRPRGTTILIALLSMVLMAGAMTVIGYGDARAQEAPSIGYPDVDPILDDLLLAKAEPDECFNGVGRPVTYPDEDGACETGVPKVNESYVWGLTQNHDSLWFGTASNVLCGVLYGYLEVTEPVLTSDYVCERSVAATTDPPMPARTDSRVPSIYEYDLATQTLYDRSGADVVEGWDDDAITMLAKTSGFRSAGSVDDIVMLAGPATGGAVGINAFAFSTDTDPPQFLGAVNLPKYSNIRKWTVVDGELYTGVGVRSSFGGGGRVLRWTGTLEDPFQFEEVGTTLSEVAELVEHEGRIFAASWPGGGFNAGVYMGPVIPEGGLTAADAAAENWQMIWTAADYEPDPVTATTYGGGALASFDGYLYWGTMHVPGRAALQHENVYGDPVTEEEGMETFLRTLRAISIFRGRDFGTDDEERQVVYGESEVSVWNPDLSQWEIQPTGMGEPIWGESGFGNPFNNYTWTMDVYDGHLFIGTMDWSYLAFGVDQSSEETMSALVEDELAALEDEPAFSFGADLFRIDSSQEPGVFEDVDGMNNPTNYGIRTMVVGDALYLGTANPMNLLTDPTDDKPEGGWELLRSTIHRELAIEPASQTLTVGTAHVVSATLTPALAGIEVRFDVTGANPGSGTAMTDDEGVAAWTYTGANPGTDEVTATADAVGRGWAVDELSASATRTWVPVEVPTTTTTSTTPGGGGGGGGSGFGSGFAPPVTAVTVPPSVVGVRIEGADRYRTAAETSARFFPDGAYSVVLATGEAFPDALSAGPVAKVLGAPLLLTQRDTLPAATAQELARLGPEEIVVVGGPAAIGDGVMDQLHELATTVIRVGGDDRYATSALLSARYFAGHRSRVYVAAGERFADALGASAAAAHHGVPLLLVGSDEVAGDVGTELTRLDPGNVYFVGGEAAIGDGVVDQVRALLAVDALALHRIAGADRFQTSALLAQSAFVQSTGKVFVATGMDYPDALAASGLGHPVMLVQYDRIADAVHQQVDRLGTDELFVLGGPAAVSDAVWQVLNS